MAKREGGSNPFLWLLLGLVVGVAAAVGAYLYLTKPVEPPDAAPAPSVKMAAPPLPPEPVAPPPAPAPVVPTPAKPADTRSMTEQMNDDAAATGMTGPATPSDDAAAAPTN